MKFPVVIEQGTQVFLRSVVERFCDSVDNLAKVVKEKKLTAQGEAKGTLNLE